MKSFDLLVQPAVLVAIIGAIATIVRYLVVKNKERKSFNRALLSEISRLLRVISSHKKYWVECMKNGNTDLPLINFSTDIYDAFLKNWGEADPNYVAHAARFYGYVFFLNRLQASKMQYPSTKLKMFDDTYLKTLDAFDNFNGKFNEAFKKFDVEMP